MYSTSDLALRQPVHRPLVLPQLPLTGYLFARSDHRYKNIQLNDILYIEARRHIFAESTGRTLWVSRM